MSKSKRHIGERLAVLSKSMGLSQTSIADKIGVPPSQINRFFRGNSDIYSSAMTSILKELGIDIEDIISKKLKTINDVENLDAKNSNDVLVYLFNELDELGQQTFLSQLLWAAKLSKGDSFSSKAEQQIRKEISLI